MELSYFANYLLTDNYLKKVNLATVDV